MKRTWLMLWLMLFGTSRSFSSEFQIARIFADNMVLQRNIPVRVWGRAHPGEQITVEFKSKTVTVRADWYGQWHTELAPLTADNNPAQMTIRAGSESVVFTNILVGEVWLASGQSNMFFPVEQAARADEEIAAANHPDLRLFTVNRVSSKDPLDDITPEEMIPWQSCTPESIRGFSAVAYYFAREIHQKLDIPVGIIHASWGGTPIESWIPVDVLQTESLAGAYLQDIFDQGLGFQSRQAGNAALWAQFNQAKASSAAEGRAFTQRPPLELAVPEGRKWPGGLWNAMIHPLAGYSLRGMIWYQGEANEGRAYAYRKLFPLMIETWRERWGQGNIPFYWVQLANYQLPLKEPAATRWAELRQAQTETLALTNTAQALSIDLADKENPQNIHPKNKQEVGRRLALLARKNIYGEPDLVAEGPVYQSHEVRDGKIIIRFNAHDEAGLTVHGDRLTGFAIAGSDKKWVWADAVLNPDGTVSVSSGKVPAPVAVRYGFETNPPINLYNQSGLPATPFRTDDWGWITAVNK